MSLDELSRTLGSALGWKPADPIASVEAVATDDSGRVQKVRFTSASGATRELRGTALRAALGYNRLKSTLFTIDLADGKCRFTGKGYGHGRGMCQQGAIGMASDPHRKSCREILSHYFPGAELDVWWDTRPAGNRSAP